MSRNQSRPIAGAPPRLRRDQRGAAAVEFAFVMIPLTLILYGLIAFGMMFALKQSMTSAASDAARAVIGASPGTEVVTAKAAVAQRMAWLGAKYTASDSPDPIVAPCVNNTSKTCITVKIDYPYGTKPLVPAAPGLGLVTPSVMRSEATVQIS